MATVVGEQGVEVGESTVRRFVPRSGPPHILWPVDSRANPIHTFGSHPGTPGQLRDSAHRPPL